ncbi:GAF domain-containing protein [Chlorogloeopsis sp. ULAP01]|uniref:GAF domain-containing protein n=1 Tax=Chlorogloeopsis sp. ULAP01 TaxID=3056483 RepID=UPI0025AB2D7C|nr:GAF domain-containing protein [Chlorogloeopsis sp. ULAP01]MDM9381387.1 GAF domain-containing protein [Chlorogloeopsis sp. ULAP01]
MTDLTLPKAIRNILDTHTEPDSVFSALVPVLGEILQCDRCFLYIRNPQTKLGKVPYCWRRSREIPEVIDSEWKLEPDSLTKEDPMFAAAIRTDPSIYVEDVETANPEVVNKEFERKQFGHKALIHAHLCQDGQLWGILQPAIFGQKRVWSKFDRAIITKLESELTPLVVRYVVNQEMQTYD